MNLLWRLLWIYTIKTKYLERGTSSPLTLNWQVKTSLSGKVKFRWSIMPSHLTMYCSPHTILISRDKSFHKGFRKFYQSSLMKWSVQECKIGIQISWGSTLISYLSRKLIFTRMWWKQTCLGLPTKIFLWFPQKGSKLRLWVPWSYQYYWHCKYLNCRRYAHQPSNKYHSWCIFYDNYKYKHFYNRTMEYGMQSQQGLSISCF